MSASPLVEHVSPCHHEALLRLVQFPLELLTDPPVDVLPPSGVSPNEPVSFNPLVRARHFSSVRNIVSSPAAAAWDEYHWSQIQDVALSLVEASYPNSHNRAAASPPKQNPHPPAPLADEICEYGLKVCTEILSAAAEAKRLTPSFVLQLRDMFLSHFNCANYKVRVVCCELLECLMSYCCHTAAIGLSETFDVVIPRLAADVKKCMAQRVRPDDPHLAATLSSGGDCGATGAGVTYSDDDYDDERQHASGSDKGRQIEGKSGSGEAHGIEVKNEGGDCELIWRGPTALHESGGWRSLETSLRAILCAIRGGGVRVVVRLPPEVIQIIFKACRHSNRYVRETSFLSISEFWEQWLLLVTATVEGVEGEHGSQQQVLKNAFIERWCNSEWLRGFSQVIRGGLQDNWSQVRFAASKATRHFLLSLGSSALPPREIDCIPGDFDTADCDENCSTGLTKNSRRTESTKQAPPGTWNWRSSLDAAILSQIIPLLFLNRHYIAEGVKLYSQATWRLVMGPRGGVGVLASCTSAVLIDCVSAISAPNHAVRESACFAISELFKKVLPTTTCSAVDKSSATFMSAAERTKAEEVLLAALFHALRDAAWPVRECCCLALADIAPLLKPQASFGSLRFAANSVMVGENKKQQQLVDDSIDVESKETASGNSCSQQQRQTCGDAEAAVLLVDQLTDNVPAVRQAAAAALAALAAQGFFLETLPFPHAPPTAEGKEQPQRLEGHEAASIVAETKGFGAKCSKGPTVIELILERCITAIAHQTARCRSRNNQYMPSGPFSVPLPRKHSTSSHLSLGDEKSSSPQNEWSDDEDNDEEEEPCNRPMYSCGSMSAKFLPSSSAAEVSSTQMELHRQLALLLFSPHTTTIAQSTADVSAALETNNSPTEPQFLFGDPRRPISVHLLNGRQQHDIKGGCMRCENHQPKQYWEMTDGGVRLFACLLSSTITINVHRARQEFLPQLIEAFDASHFRKHLQLKLTIVQRLKLIWDKLNVEDACPDLAEKIKTRLSTRGGVVVPPPRKQEEDCDTTTGRPLKIAQRQIIRELHRECDAVLSELASMSIASSRGPA